MPRCPCPSVLARLPLRHVRRPPWEQTTAARGTRISFCAGGDGGLDPLQPGLAPVRVDLARAEEPPRAALAGAHRALELDAVVAEPQHPTGVLLDDVRD